MPQLPQWEKCCYGGPAHRSAWFFNPECMEDRHFAVADMNRRGELVRSAHYGYEQLEQIPGTPDLIAGFAAALWRDPDGFEIPLGGVRGMDYRWRASAPTAGIGTLRHGGELASLCLIASGIDPEADRITLAAFQHRLLTCLRDTPFEPAFQLLELSDRPLVATVEFQAPADRQAQYITALADRCLAAACFRRLGLV